MPVSDVSNICLLFICTINHGRYLHFTCKYINVYLFVFIVEQNLSQVLSTTLFFPHFDSIFHLMALFRYELMKKNIDTNTGDSLLHSYTIYTALWKICTLLNKVSRVCDNYNSAVFTTNEVRARGSAVC